jgi:hypothetical protein
MRRSLKNLIRNATHTLITFLIILSGRQAIVSADSLTVEMNKYPTTYNIGDSVSITGTATPNASVSIKILDPNNVTKVASEVPVAFNGNYWMEDGYILKVTDESGTWRVIVHDLSSNKIEEVVFIVVAIEDRLKTLGDQLTSLQNKVQTLNVTIEILKTSVENLSSRLSAAETSSATLSMITYGTLATSTMSIALSIMAITLYFQKRNIYNRLIGKTKKDKTKQH